MTDSPADIRHKISIVIPVYRGETTLRTVIDELLPYTRPFRTPGGHLAQVSEVILAYDRGPDRSDAVMRELAGEHDFVKNVWLSRNFGQHAATLAGIASSGGDWIVTIDEDGQQDPSYIGPMIDTAVSEGAEVVYAKPTNKPPHGAVRNAASRLSKRILAKLFGSGNASDFNSFRLILGEIGRSVAAYTGTGVYLDVALTWVTNRQVTCPVELREEIGRPSGYSYVRLLGHFWRMVLSTGTRGLRLVTVLGVAFAAIGVVYAIYLTVTRFVSGDIPEGWTSQMVMTLLGTGAILVSLGIVAEYIGVVMNMAMGKPPYLLVRDPAQSPLYDDRPVTGRGEPSVNDAPPAPRMGADWVIGRGLLGNAVARALPREPFRHTVRWRDADASVADLIAARDELYRLEGPEVTIYWCAGSGVTATPPEVLRAEAQVFARFMASFADVEADVRARTTLFLASSVGGAYAGNPAPPYTETSQTRALSPYGETKLAMEDAFVAAVEDYGMRGFVGRITNLYGPGQKLGKKQGLISVICETYFTGQPASVYVSLDTLRDYIFEDDCAAVVVAGARRAAGLAPGTAVTKIIGAGTAVSIGELMGVVSRLRRRRPLVAFGGGSARGQAPDLRIRSEVWPDLQRHVSTTLPAGIAATFRAIAAGTAAGRLSDPLAG